MRARGTGRRLRDKRRAGEEEEGELAVLKALARRAAVEDPAEHARFLHAALAVEAAHGADGDQDNKKVPPAARADGAVKDGDDEEDENDEAEEGAEEAVEEDGIARRCWRALLASGGGGERSEQLLAAAAAGAVAAVAAVHVMLDLGGGGGGGRDDDACDLLAALARAPVPRALPAAAHACALANRATAGNPAAAERATRLAAAARQTDFWQLITRLVTIADPVCGDADGADASPVAVLFLRPAEIPATLVADLLGPRWFNAEEAGGSSPLPLHAAAAQGDLGLIRKLLLRGGAVGARIPGSGETALHVASSSSAAAALLEAGSAVSGRDGAGHTALAAAAAEDNAHLVAELLDAGACFEGEPGVKVGGARAFVSENPRRQHPSLLFILW
jgi:hypothetical protein